MKQQEYWDSVSDSKNFTTPFHAEEFLRFVGKDKSILDVGCGYGRTLNELSQAGYQNLIGVDFSEGMIKRGQAQFPGLELRIMKESAIPLPDASVDAAILFGVLTCICDNAEQTALIEEICRVLKPDGILYVNDFLLNTDERNLARYEKYQDLYGIYGVFELPEGALLRHHDEAWLRQLFSPFTILKYQHLTFTTMNGHTSNGFYFIGQKKRL